MSPQYLFAKRDARQRRNLCKASGSWKSRARRTARVRPPTSACAARKTMALPRRGGMNITEWDWGPHQRCSEKRGANHGTPETNQRGELARYRSARRAAWRAVAKGRMREEGVGRTGFAPPAVNVTVATARYAEKYVGSEMQQSPRAPPVGRGGRECW